MTCESCSPARRSERSYQATQRIHFVSAYDGILLPTRYYYELTDWTQATVNWLSTIPPISNVSAQFRVPQFTLILDIALPFSHLRTNFGFTCSAPIFMLLLRHCIVLAPSILLIFCALLFLPHCFFFSLAVNLCLFSFSRSLPLYCSRYFRLAVSLSLYLSRLLYFASVSRVFLFLWFFFLFLVSTFSLLPSHLSGFKRFSQFVLSSSFENFFRRLLRQCGQALSHLFVHSLQSPRPRKALRR